MRTLYVLALLLGLRLISAEIPKPTEQALDAMFDIYPNTMLAYSFGYRMADFDKKTDSFKKALKNGVRCELKTDQNQKDAEEAFVKLYYPGGKTTEYTTDQEAERTNAATELRIDCTTQSTEAVHKCLCTDKKFTNFCKALSIKAVADAEANNAPVVCSDVPMAALKTIAPSLHASFTKEKAEKAAAKSKTIDDDFDEVIAEITPDANILCEVMEPSVQTAVKNLYESDSQFMTMERSFFEILFPDHELFGEKAFDIETECANDEIDGLLKACVCKGELGLQVCYYKWLAEYFKGEGFLECKPDTADATKPKKAALDQAKKPAKGKAKPPRKPKAAKVTTAPAAATTKAPAKSAPAAAVAAALLLVPAAMLV